MNRIVIALLLWSCGKGEVKNKGDDCQRFIEKMAPTFAGEDGKYSDEDKARLVYECRKNTSPLRPDPAMQCVLDAKDDEAVKLCMRIADEGKPQKPEASLRLNNLAKNAKVYYNTNAEFPKGSAKALPPKPCCKGPGGKCPVVLAAEWAADPIWSALDFTIDEPSNFQYSYKGDGKSATVTAIGDLDCDGRAVTYRLELSSPSGNASALITEPAPNTD